MGLFDFVGDAVGDVGDFITGGDLDRKARRQLGKGVQEFEQINVPTLEDQALQLENYRLQGMLTPEMEMAIRQGRSELGGVQPVDQYDSEYWNIQTDPQLRQAQMRALQQMQDVGAQGGLTAVDRAQLGDVQTQLDEQNRGQQQAILQNMRARGVGGSGLEAAAALQSQQAAATRGSRQGLDVAAMAQKRALEAMMSAGQLGGQIRQQGFDEQAQTAQAQDAINRYNAQARLGLQMSTAQAQDAINRYNTENQQSVMQRNVGTSNQAQQQNLQNAQQLANSNVELRNKQQQYNRELQQQQFNNRMQRAGGVAGQYGQMAGAYGQAGQARREMIGGVIDSATKAAGAA